MPRLGLLICDTPKPNVLSVHGSYKEIFHSLLKNSLERTRPGEHVEWTLDGFDVVNQVYPPPDDIDSYDGFLISGSGQSFVDHSFLDFFCSAERVRWGS